MMENIKQGNAMPPISQREASRSIGQLHQEYLDAVIQSSGWYISYDGGHAWFQQWVDERGNLIERQVTGKDGQPCQTENS